MTKISIKTQTNRTTKFNDKLNCVNLFLNDFEIGLITRRWGENKEGEHRITFRIDKHDYEMNLELFKTKLRKILKNG